MKSRTPALIAAIGANLIYGLNFVVAKGIMPDFLQPRAIILLRVVGATLVFWFVSMFTPKERPNTNDMLTLALASVFGVAINQIFFFEGLNLTTPINASIIMVCVPIAVMLFSRAIRGERLNPLRLIGIAMGTAGAAILILKDGQLNFSSSTSLGNLLVVINASSYALYLVLIKPVMVKYHPITVMKWVFLFGNISVIPVTFQVAREAQWQAIPFSIWISIAYVVLFTTVLAYYLNNFSLKKISPTTNAVFIYMQPFFTTVVAVLLGKDQPVWTMLLPAFLIFTGVYLVSMKRLPRTSD